MPTLDRKFSICKMVCDGKTVRGLKVVGQGSFVPICGIGASVVTVQVVFLNAQASTMHETSEDSYEYF